MRSALSALALAVALGAAVLFQVRHEALKERLAALELEMSLDEAQDDSEPAAPLLSGGRTAREVAELRRLNNALVLRVDQQETRLRAFTEGRGEEGGQVPGAPKGGGRAAVAALRTAAFAEAVRDVVLEMADGDVAFRSKIGTAERTKLSKNAPFTKLADLLELDASQESQMSKDLQTMQQELFGLLSEQRDDGLVPLEMIARAESLKEGDVERTQIFMKLFGLRIPGEEETYMQRAMELQGDFRKKTSDYLRPAQLEIWQNLEVDLFSVKFD